MSTNIKAFWNFVNAKRSTKGIPNCLHLNEIKANNDTDGANLFAEFFQSVFSTRCTVASNYYDVHDTPLHLSDLSVDISDVLAKLDSLDCNGGPGDDTIPPIVLKQCKFILARPLWLILINP